MGDNVPVCVVYWWMVYVIDSDFSACSLRMYDLLSSYFDR